MSEEIFKTLEAFKHVIVTGPQRSGTTICAAMLGSSHVRSFLPDERIGQDRRELLDVYLRSPHPWSLQAPALFYCIDQIKANELAIVVMRRPGYEINASIDRINWDGGQEELDRYLRRADFNPTLVPNDIPLSKAIYRIKYDFWETYQRPRMQVPCFEIEHSSLRWHPMWLNKPQRKEFWPRQISLEYTNAQEENL